MIWYVSHDKEPALKNATEITVLQQELQKSHAKKKFSPFSRSAIFREEETLQG